MRDEREIHYFLHGRIAQHRKTRLTASHNVRMVSENIERVSGKRARRNVENAGHKLARDFVHVGDH